MEFRIELLESAANFLNELPPWLQGIVEAHIRALAKSPLEFSLSEPCPAPHHGERYSWFEHGPIEGQNHHFAIFFNVDAEKFPVEEVDAKTLRYGDDESLDEATIDTANLSAPIILAEISPGRFNVVDGNHRLERAHREGVEKIPAYRVGAAHHQAFLTSERGYKAYIDYWNSKIDDINK